MNYDLRRVGDTLDDTICLVKNAKGADILCVGALQAFSYSISGSRNPAHSGNLRKCKVIILITMVGHYYSIKSALFYFPFFSQRVQWFLLLFFMGQVQGVCVCSVGIR